jgi:hypothetical protein
MTLLQIDSLSQLRGNSGFWDNFVWPLLLALVIGLFIILRKKIFPEKKKINDKSTGNNTFNEQKNKADKITNQVINNYGIGTSKEVLDRIKIIEDQLIQSNKDNIMAEKKDGQHFHISSEGQSGGITAGIVNISGGNHHQSPNEELKDIISKNMKTLKAKFPQHPSIILEVESGNSHRNKIANTLEEIMIPFQLGNFPKGNTFMGRFPDHSITVIGNNNNIDFLKNFVSSISPYLTSDDWFYEVADDFPGDFIKIYFNGNPVFDVNGKVKID